MSQAQSKQLAPQPSQPMRRLITLLNERWHKPALMAFLVVVIAHWAEHLAQAFQVYALH